jgi:hypothetical protein
MVCDKDVVTLWAIFVFAVEVSVYRTNTEYGRDGDIRKFEVG